MLAHRSIRTQTCLVVATGLDGDDDEADDDEDDGSYGGDADHLAADGQGVILDMS